MSAAASTKKETPFGSWPSPITAKFITSTGVRLGALSVDDSSTLHWLEGRPQEGGRQAVVKYSPGSDGASERGGLDVTPKETNVRTRVHEYGGGAYILSPGGGIIYSDFKTQRLFWSKPGTDEPMALTPDSDAFPDGRYRFADGCLHPSGDSIVLVREDHGPKGDANPKDVVNEVITLKLDGSGEMTVLATGRDFYAHPRLDAAGNMLAYVCWDHPSMPWDATELRVTSVEAAIASPSSGTGTSGGGHRLAAGDTTPLSADGDTSVLQPAWHPTSGALYFISDTSGYWNLMRMEQPDPSADTPLPIAEARTNDLVDHGGSSPGWSFGQQGYTFLPDGRLAAAYPDRSTGRTALLLLDDTADATAAEASKTILTQEAGLPHSFGSLTPAPDGSTLYMLGGAPDASSGVYSWGGLPPPSSAGKDDAPAAVFAPAKMIACSSSAEIDADYISVPSPVEFPAPLGTSYGFYYPPTNKLCECNTEGALPPLLVKAHGGPTSCTSTIFNPSIQFWTSRGFAVLDVDYGGSTGYGKEYRRRLRKNWGVVDVDDVCAGAEYLVSRGLADPKRLCIDGGSAGGYTTLGALAFKDVFSAGCSLYGIGDLATLAGDTHKFESRYLDGLVGLYPEEADLYAERAPIKNLDGLSCPVLLLQGAEDKVVPPNQATLMHEALLGKGLPCAIKIYEGEQHGFRQAKNIEDALNSEYYFFARVLGFEAVGEEVVPFEIDNLAAA